MYHSRKAFQGQQGKLSLANDRSCTSILRINLQRENQVKCICSAHRRGGYSMADSLVFNALLLLALLWIGVMVYGLWPSGPTAPVLAHPQPDKPTPRRSPKSAEKPRHS